MDLIAFVLGLRDQGVFVADAVIKLNGRWGVNEVARVASGHYKAQHKDGILRLEAVASAPAPERQAGESAPAPERQAGESAPAPERQAKVASAPAACVFEVRFVIKTASLIDNTETWTLNLAKAALSVERKPTGPLKGIGARIAGKDAFCYTSSLRAAACTDSQLFDDHTPLADDADLDRKAAELESVLAKLKAAGCGGG